MALFGLFGKKAKPNLTPDVTRLMPASINPVKHGELSKLSSDYIAGRGTGFGDDFLDKTTNPVASSMRRNFQNVTSPLLDNQYASRGLSRSNLAADAQGKAAGDVESDIGVIMADLYKLNEIQKKGDTQFGANIAQNLLSGDTAQHNSIADASERLSQRTQDQANTNAAIDRQTGDKALAGVSTLLTGLPMFSGSTSQGPDLTSILRNMGAPNLAMPGAGGINGGSPVAARTLDNVSSNQVLGMNPAQIRAMLDEYFG